MQKMSKPVLNREGSDSSDPPSSTFAAEISSFNDQNDSNFDSSGKETWHPSPSYDTTKIESNNSGASK